MSMECIMPRFEVSGMTCSHCAEAVAKAVRAVDPGAKVEVDLAGGKVAVQSTSDPSRIAGAIEAAGYGARQEQA